MGSDVMEFTDVGDDDDDDSDDDEFDGVKPSPSDMLSVDMDETPNPIHFLATNSPGEKTTTSSSVKTTTKPTANTTPPVSVSKQESNGPPVLNIAVAPRRKRTKQSFQEEFLTLEHAKLDMLKKASKDENDDTRQFLLSLVSNVKKMTAKQELEFRIDVQKLIRDYTYPKAASFDRAMSGKSYNNMNKSSPDSFRSQTNSSQMEKNTSMDNRSRANVQMDNRTRTTVSMDNLPRSTVPMDNIPRSSVPMDNISRSSVPMDISRSSVAMDNIPRSTLPMDNFTRSGLPFDNRSNITMDNHLRTISQQQQDNRQGGNVPVSQMHPWAMGSRLMPL